MNDIGTKEEREQNWITLTFDFGGLLDFEFPSAAELETFYIARNCKMTINHL